MTSPIRSDCLQHLLVSRDLTDRRQGEHALQPLSRNILQQTASTLELPLRVVRSLGLRRADDGSLRLKPSPASGLEEALFLMEEEGGEQEPGLLACFDRAQSLEQDGVVGLRTHRLALWCPEKGPEDPLPLLVGSALRAALPGCCYRLVPDRQPDLARVFRMDVRDGGDWMAVGFCGREAGGNAAGFVGVVLDLEALLVQRKGLPEHALIYSSDVSVQAQMVDLEPWKTLEELALPSATAE
ncbi:MAG: hypothetical protein JJU06_14335 [Ectothiorhodospiraceae bacterium]|nr:hypothetical protein [Ectothiorhodospiraceae bacterium]MCH8505324.1 hypothetical protein [Ectothiorhodospiraceae bacterium]